MKVIGLWVSFHNNLNHCIWTSVEEVMIETRKLLKAENRNSLKSHEAWRLGNGWQLVTATFGDDSARIDNSWRLWRAWWLVKVIDDSWQQASVTTRQWLDDSATLHTCFLWFTKLHTSFYQVQNSSHASIKAKNMYETYKQSIQTLRNKKWQLHNQIHIKT